MIGTLYPQYTATGAKVARPKGIRVDLSIDAQVAYASHVDERGRLLHRAEHAIYGLHVDVHAESLVIQGCQRAAGKWYRWQAWIFVPQSMEK